MTIEAAASRRTRDRETSVVRCSLVVADVDGTLLTPEKVVTSRVRRALRRMRACGIGFTVVTSRPPAGLAELARVLELDVPAGAFNGASLIAPDLAPIEEHTMAPSVVAETLTLLRDFAVEPWVFRRDEWLLTQPNGPYVERQQCSTGLTPKLIGDFGAVADGVLKIVGVSDDQGRLWACERAARRQLEGRATVAQSRRQYLDFTGAGIDKGLVIGRLAETLAIQPAEILTIGDMENDLPMFRRSGFSIAMGNASRVVKSAAHAVTAANTDEGFALAMEWFVLSGRAAVREPGLTPGTYSEAGFCSTKAAPSQSLKGRVPARVGLRP